MPQLDRYKNRMIPIEFTPTEDLLGLPYQDRYTLIFITDGSVGGHINGIPISICAPGVLYVTEHDTMEITKLGHVAAQSFRFHPSFFNTALYARDSDNFSPDLKIRTGLSLFQREGRHFDIPVVTDKAFPKLLEWFFMLGTETFAQSDARWVCRIKRYLIQILGLLEDLSRTGHQTPVDLVLEYIHARYPEKITLGDLTRCAHLNRVSLNELFQERFAQTAMGYLLSHRLKVAGDLLTHTAMSLNEIARISGFGYDTYFIRRFTAKSGMSPTEYRSVSRKTAALR